MNNLLPSYVSVQSFVLTNSYSFNVRFFKSPLMMTYYQIDLTKFIQKSDIKSINY